MRPRTSALRVAALVACAVLVLHELRYLVGFGSHSRAALAGGEHAYVPFAGTAAVLLLALAAAQLLVALRCAGRGGGAARPPAFPCAWLAISATLLAVYAGQELLESLLFGGGLGLDLLLAHEGWSSLPLALALGAVAALLMREAARALDRRARLRHRPESRPSPARRPAPAPALGSRSPIARHLASRAPPAGPAPT